MRCYKCHTIYNLFIYDFQDETKIVCVECQIETCVIR